jgi:hypothetical protein
MEANCLGFEHAKHSHACIATDMEDGLYNREALIIITAPMPVKETRSYQETFSKNSKNQQFSGRKPEFRKADPGEKLLSRVIISMRANMSTGK